MLILGKNRDYYDGVVGTMGIDKTIVYNRHTVENDDCKKFPKEFKCKLHYSDDESKFIDLCSYGIDSDKTKKYKEVDVFFIGFCGKIYIGWKFYYLIGNGIHEKMKYDIVYDIDVAKKYIKDNRWGSGNLNDILNHIKNYNPIELFRENNTPIFIYDSHIDRIDLDKYYGSNNQRFIINPVLKEYKFYKVFDTFSAFQEIQMFISGVLGSNEKDIIEVEDKYKIAQHGFNKWSFRREPSKKKK